MITVTEIVDSGLCIGCGLCESISPDTIRTNLNENGVERPEEGPETPSHKLALINAVCPGLRVELEPGNRPTDPMWGPVLRLARGYSTDPAVRFRSAAGGVLSGLGRYVLARGMVERVLHLAPSEASPLYWAAHVSETPEDIMRGAGSRYGPGAPLTPLIQLIEEGRPLAVIAKPCDAAAGRNLIRVQPTDVVRYIMVMACGGASRMTKTWNLLDAFGINRTDIASFRHRGYGNPGASTATAKDGRSRSVTYREMWEDEGTWDLQWRCKVCPDGMGEVADIVGLDCWPGGAPTAEDPGYDGIIARTESGAELLANAIDDGVIEIDRDGLQIDETLESWQPHQSRRKAAVSSRLRAMRDEGLPTLETQGLRLDVAEERLNDEAKDRERNGARQRIRDGLNI